MSKLEFKIEDKDGKMRVVWDNGASQDATPVEVELWKRNRDLEAAGALLAKYLSPKVLEDASVCLKKLADLKPDKSAVSSSATASSKSVTPAKSPSVYGSSDPSTWSEARKRFEKRKKERADAAKHARERNADTPRFGKRAALAGPRGFIPG